MSVALLKTAAPATLPSGRSFLKETAMTRALVEQRLPSARLVLVRVAGGAEELEVRSPTGEVELSITLTAAGPVLRLRAARVEVEAEDTVRLGCRRFEVQASEAVHLHGEQVLVTGGEARVRTEGDVHLNGDVVRINC